MKANRLVLPLVLSLMAAACVAPSAPPPAPPPPPRPAPPPPAPPPPAPADWRDAPRSEGTWHWAMTGGRSVASYGRTGAAPVATLTCDPARHATILWRTGPAVGEVPLVVTTTGTHKLLTARPDGTGGASVALSPSDPLLDAIAFSRGRFMLEIPGAPTLYLPSWPELSRVIEDCR